MARKKTVFERFFSLNWHRKRFGAAKHLRVDPHLSAMKIKVIEGDANVQTWGSSKSLDEHLASLRREFAGQPEILWYHAKLIVLIRREYQTKATFAKFSELWAQECDFLCANLNVRWLVSAADTFADHASDGETRALAALVAVLVNTVKIYETERTLASSEQPHISPARIDEVQRNFMPLFSGLSCFTVGTDDTLRNMRWRLDPLMAKEPVGRILRTVFDRLQIEDTAYARLKRLHKRERTGWWSP